MTCWGGGVAKRRFKGLRWRRWRTWRFFNSRFAASRQLRAPATLHIRGGLLNDLYFITKRLARIGTLRLYGLGEPKLLSQDHDRNDVDLHH